MSAKESLKALRRVSPSSRPGFDESIEEYDELRMQIASTAYPAPRSSAARQLVQKRRLIGFSAVGALLSTAAVLAAVALFTGSSPQSAYAAANAAVAATSANAVDSGTIVTRLSGDGTVMMTQTTRWNGSDISLVIVSAAGQASELRLIGENIYEQPPSSDGRWTHYAGDASESGFMKVMLASAQADVAGTTTRNILDVTDNLERVDNADGSTTYKGTAKANSVIGRFDVTGAPRAVRTLAKAFYRSTEASVELTVSSDGQISRLSVGYRMDGITSTETSDFSRLGSTAAITAPDPGKVVEAKPVEPKPRDTVPSQTTTTG
jgi:hypothetical protein